MLIDLIQLLKVIYFIALKAEVATLDINKLVNVPTSLNSLNTKVDNLNVGKSKTVPIDLKKLSDEVSKKVVKNVKFIKLNTKENNLEKNLPGVNYFNSHKSMQHR